MSYNISVPLPNTNYLGPSVTQCCPGSQFLFFMTLVDYFIRAKNDISHLNERVKSKNLPPASTYDFIVVGGEYKLLSSSI